VNKRLLIAAVLALAVLSLGVAAAPALAQYPETGVPYTAYVHLWWGSEPIIWEECDGTAPDANWYWWSASAPGAPELWPYKPIPADYDIVFVAYMMGIPKGQMVAMPGNLLFSAKVKDPAGAPLWSITTKAAKRYWGTAFGPDGWAMPTINKELAQMWVIAWTYDIGNLKAGTYTGAATYTYKHPMIDQTVWDPSVPMKTPAHYTDKGTYTAGCTFVVE
jgi:hypothetical protein